ITPGHHLIQVLVMDIEQIAIFLLQSRKELIQSLQGRTAKILQARMEVDRVYRDYGRNAALKAIGSQLHVFFYRQVSLSWLDVDRAMQLQNVMLVHMGRLWRAAAVLRNMNSPFCPGKVCIRICSIPRCASRLWKNLENPCKPLRGKANQVHLPFRRK